MEKKDFLVNECELRNLREGLESTPNGEYFLSRHCIVHNVHLQWSPFPTERVNGSLRR